MPQKSDATVHILEKKATLFKRALTPHWHVRFKAHGKWYRVTTKTDDLKEAKDVAVKIVTKAWHREEDNLPIVSKRFKNVAHLAIQRMKDAESARLVRLHFSASSVAPTECVSAQRFNATK